MATTTWTNDTLHTSDATFRAWGKDISDALDAIGFSKTADTGQVNWATVTRPGTATTVYEIRYMNDSLHGACPLYLKIEYGTGSAADRPIVFITVGTKTDGAGTLGGTMIHARTQSGGSVAGASTVRNGAACMASGTMALAFSYDTASPAIDCGFGISRTCDPNGTPNANGAYVWIAGSVSTITSRQYCRKFGQVVAGHAVCGMGDTGRTTLNNGSDIFSATPWIWTHQANPLLGPVGIMSADRTAGTTFTMTVCGATHTYFPFNITGGPLTVDGLNANFTFAILWE